MATKVYRAPGIHWTWYNVESTERPEFAVTFRLHDGEDLVFENALKTKGIPVEYGMSCPVAWIDYKKVKNDLRDRETHEAVRVVFETLGSTSRPVKTPEEMIDYHGATLASPCNSIFLQAAERVRQIEKQISKSQD